MTFNVSLSVKRQTSEGYSPSFRNLCKEPTMTTVLNLSTLLLSPLFDGFEEANVSVDTGKKTVTITAGTTTFSKVVDQVLVKEGDEPLKDGAYNVTLGVEEAVLDAAKVILSCIKMAEVTTTKAVKTAAAVVGEKATKRSTSGCRYNPDLIGY